MDVFSASRLLRAPKKVKKTKSYDLESVRRNLFNSSPPPPPPPQRRRRRTAFRLSPLPLVWGESPELLEAQALVESGDIRSKFLLISPEDVAETKDVEQLEKLWELYIPTGQPHTHYEEAYLQIMRDCIDARLDMLTL